jgi:hypothetical protein
MKELKSVFCLDSTNHLENYKGDNVAVITSLPDMEEMGLDFHEWNEWFKEVSYRLSLNYSLCIFYQTDRRKDGRVISKSNLILNSAEKANKNILFHKIQLRKKLGSIDLYRPAYTHLIAVSLLKNNLKKPCVLGVGRKLYKNGMDVNSAKLAAEVVKNYGFDTVFDPFCGMGTVLAVSNSLGLNSIGIDIDPEQVRLSELLVIDKEIDFN